MTRLLLVAWAVGVYGAWTASGGDRGDPFAVFAAGGLAGTLILAAAQWVQGVFSFDEDEE